MPRADRAPGFRSGQREGLGWLWYRRHVGGRSHSVATEAGAPF